MTAVAITGIGAVTPVGNDAPTTWRNLRDGVSGVGAITTFDASDFPVGIAGMVRDFTLDPSLANASERRHLSRGATFGLAAGAEAIESAKIGEGDYAPHERGTSVAGSVGRPTLQEFSDYLSARAADPPTVERMAPADVLQRDQNMPALALARLGDCAGPMVGVSTACAGSVHAIGEGMRLIQDGDAAMVVAGGYDALTTWLDVLGFALLGALTTDHADEPWRASRPFSGDRGGFVLGEGAVFVVLEDADRARARGATIHALLAGYGTSMNAYRMTDAPPDGSGPDLAMARALADAGMAPTQVQYIAAHGTGTPGNDVCETAAIKTVFGDHAHDLLISSPKSMAGHLTGGSGGLGLLVALGAIREGVVAPTINLEVPDPKLDLDYVPNQARTATVDGALVNAFAFGGTNASLAVRRDTGEGA